MEWEGDHTALQDILLLLSLFTGREVFVLDEATQGTIVLDPRTYQWGGSLRVAIPYKGERLKDLEESIIQVEKTDEAGNSTFMELDLYPWQCDTGLEEELNRIYELIRIPNWQKKYGKGYFLFLARTAFRRQTLEASFIQCWTIWEHLFALHTSSWFPEKEIQRFSAQYKIAYLLVEYSLKNEIKSEGQRSIETLVSVRNRLIHYGRFPESGAGHNEAVLFIRLTEFIIAKIFQLSPSNLFNTVERLEEFLNGQLSKQ